MKSVRAEGIDDVFDNAEVMPLVTVELRDISKPLHPYPYYVSFEFFDIQVSA